MNPYSQQQRNQQRMMDEQRRRMMQYEWQRRQNVGGIPEYRANQPSIIIRFIKWVWTAFWTFVALAIVLGVVTFIVLGLTNAAR